MKLGSLNDFQKARMAMQPREVRAGLFVEIPLIAQLNRPEGGKALDQPVANREMADTLSNERGRVTS
jgi:hypothetical protein